MKEKHDSINHPEKIFTMTILGEIIESESKRDIPSVLGDGTDCSCSQPWITSYSCERSKHEQNRTEKSARPRLMLGRAVASHNRKQANKLHVIRSFYSFFQKSRDGERFLHLGISAF